MSNQENKEQETRLDPSVPKLRRSMSIQFQRHNYYRKEQESWKDQKEYLKLVEGEVFTDLFQNLEKFQSQHTKPPISYYSIAPGIYLKTEVVTSESTLANQVMKLDHFEGVPNLGNSKNRPDFELPPSSVAPNLRRIPELPFLFGVGQPTLDALQAIVREANNKFKPESIVWINLREEPTLYIDNKPYSPRDPETLNINLEYLLGIQGIELESVEMQLRADLLRKAFLNGEGILDYYYQDSQMKNIVRQEKITRRSIKCLHEVYNNLAETYPVKYYRIPITDESEPELQDLNYLTEVFRENLNSGNVFIFNCQMGRGRTTTALVTAFLFYQCKKKWAGTRQDLIEENEEEDNSFDESNPDLDNGEFPVIIKLVSTLRHGKRVKRQVDYAIDACGEFINLRKSVADVWRQSEKETNVEAKDLLKTKFRNYLERYWWLIVYNYYLFEVGPNGDKFSSWIRGYWRIRHFLKKL